MIYYMLETVEIFVFLRYAKFEKFLFGLDTFAHVS